jgi:hypothetical protein
VLQALGNRCDYRRAATKLGKNIDQISARMFRIYDGSDAIGSEMNHAVSGLSVSLGQVSVG